MCGEALDSLPSLLPELCAACRRLPPAFDLAVSFSSYDGVLRELLHLLKYEQLRPAAKLVGERLAQVVSAVEVGPEGETALVIPVPLHKSRRRERGYNQSELISRAMLQFLPRSRFQLRKAALCRTRATVSQTGLTRHQRRENVRGAFELASPESVRDRCVLLIDDVYTTGTTLNECARVLRRAGARRVVVATVARVYRMTAELTVSGMSLQEENPRVSAGTLAG